MKCRLCNAELEYLFVDLGSSPAANSFLTKEQLDQPEMWYPLKVYVCDQCWLVQMDEYKPATEIFNEDYPYYSSHSENNVVRAKAYVDMMVERFNPQSVLEIGSNDGYLLQWFKEKGVSCTGIDPADGATKIARDKGISTYCGFFNYNFALSFQDQFDLICGSNVLAHQPNLNDFLEGLRIALKPNGVITMEFPTVMNLLNGTCQFDTCLLQGEKIITPSGMVSVEAVKRGDVVLTHTGCILDVTHTMSREYSGKQYDIFVYGHSAPLRVTEDHPVLIQKEGCSSWVKARDIKKGDVMFRPSLPNLIIDLPSITVKHLKSRGKKPSEERITSFPINASLAKVSGYYLAEGFYNCRGRNSSSVEFAFGLNDKEKKLAEDCATALRDLGAKGNIRLTQYGWHVHTYGPMAKMLYEQFGTGEKNKHLASWCYNLPEQLTHLLVMAYVNGDGYVYRNGRYLRASSISAQLADGISLLSNKLGWCCSINKQKPTPSRIIHKNKKPTLNAHPSYDILIRTIERRKCKVWFEDKKQYGKIKKVIVNDYNGFVYNLEVDKDNSYVTPQGAVHNCYHEHFSYLSFTVVCDMFYRHGMEVFDVLHTPEQGGSIMVFAKHAEDRQPLCDSVFSLLLEEQETGISTLAPYQGFQSRVEDAKHELLEFLVDRKWMRGETVAAYGASCKCNTLLNYCGIRPDLIPFVVDRSPLKQGKYMPGSHIPIVDEEYLKREKPDYVLITAWNLKDEIMKQLSYIREWGGKFVMTTPEMRVI